MFQKNLKTSAKAFNENQICSKLIIMYNSYIYNSQDKFNNQRVLFYPRCPNGLDKVTTLKRCFELNLPFNTREGLREYCCKVSASELFYYIIG